MQRIRQTYLPFKLHPVSIPIPVIVLIVLQDGYPRNSAGVLILVAGTHTNRMRCVDLRGLLLPPSLTLFNL